MSGTKQVHHYHSRSGRGIGFFSILGLIFINLKLCGVITWPWIWVLTPLWIPFVILLTILTLVGLVALTVTLITLIVVHVEEYTKKKK